MQFRFKTVSGKAVAIASLALVFVLIAGTAFASLTFNSTAITSDGALTLNPTGQPVTVNGNLTVTGSCTGCGGAPGGSNTQIQFNNNGAFGGSPKLTWDASNGGDVLLSVNAIEMNGANLFGDGDLYGTNGFITGNNGVGQGLNGVQFTLNTLAGTATQDVLSMTGGGFFNQSYLPLGRTLTQSEGIAVHVSNLGAGTTTNASGVYAQLDNNDGGQTTNGRVIDAWMYGTNGSITDYRGVSITNAIDSASITNLFAFWAGDFAASATNPYYSWFDSRGVRRVKEDPTVDGGNGQAIEALYNPRFTKYTPGATNYERLILGQWNNNVAQIGTEAGGTGTLRSLELLGSAITLNAATSVTGSVTTTDVITTPVTVSGLPTCNSGAKGAHAFVTDANATTFHSTAVGGGSNNIAVACDGTNWKIGG
jgi:hypothetical protein